MRLELSAEADDDLDDIVRYSIRAHGVEQARTYVAGLRERMNALTQQPDGKRIEGLDPSLLRTKFRSHFIFFRVQGDAVLVSRILHERRDIRRHLR